MSMSRENELLKACPFPLASNTWKNGKIRLKVKSDRGESRWLDISPEEFRMIENILLDTEN